MELTPKQMAGLNTAIERYRDGEKYTCISGYAGSGKSTLVKFIVSALQIPEEEICYTAFTGKACNVLQKKGNKNVCTLHRLLYEHFPRQDGTFFKRPKETLYPYTVIIVDEVSMASKDLMNQLFTHPVYVICLGDPFQLPTINPADDNHLLDHPHVFLDEVHRQAQESEIIRLSMDIRAQKSLELFDGHDVKVYNRDDLSTGMLMWADQILCGTNNTRIGINTQMRDLLGREGGPQDGDKVIALRNEWDTLSAEHEPLVNGTIGVLQNSYSTTRSYPRYILNGGTFKVLHSDFYTDGDATYTDLNMDQVMIETGEKCCSRELEYKLNKNPRSRGIVPLEFTYGYAITTHKAQGSQWPNVLVVEERFPFDKTEHARWLYTACTRAEERLVLIRK